MDFLQLPRMNKNAIGLMTAGLTTTWHKTGINQHPVRMVKMRYLGESPPDIVCFLILYHSFGAQLISILYIDKHIFDVTKLLFTSIDR